MADPNQRRSDAAKRLELAAAAAQSEAAAAQLHLDAFVAEAKARGLSPEALQATLLDGRRVKTSLVGWYLNAARTVAVGPQGEFFNLVTQGSPLARLRGVTLARATPVLEIGRGGRDGETGSLVDFLARALENYANR